MKITGSILPSIAIILAIATSNAVWANEVEILSAEFRNNGNQRWSANVTLEHSDTGWEHYADEWRVVDGDNHVLGNRVLYHPHVDEQPFTRSLSGILVPKDITTVFIEAHDKVHGWSSSRLEINLNNANDAHLRVERK